MRNTTPVNSHRKGRPALDGAGAHLEPVPVEKLATSRPGAAVWLDSDQVSYPEWAGWNQRAMQTSLGLALQLGFGPGLARIPQNSATGVGRLKHNREGRILKSAP